MPWIVGSPEHQRPWYWLSEIAWWRHQMETFSALLAICAGNSPVTGEFHAQRPVTRSFDVFFDLRLNNRLSKQCWWFDVGDLRRYRAHYDVTVMSKALVSMGKNNTLDNFGVKRCYTLQMQNVSPQNNSVWEGLKWIRRTASKSN